MNRTTECPVCLAPIRCYEIKEHVRPCLNINAGLKSLAAASPVIAA